MAYLVGGICVINIVLWIVFFIKFNRRFSTQKIIEQTRTEMNELVKDMQRNTSSSIELINASIAQLRQVSAEADKKVILLNKKLEVINSDIELKVGAQKIHSAVQNEISKTNGQKSNAAGYNSAPKIAQKKSSPVYPPINSAQAYQVNKSSQKDLFEEEPIEIKDEVIVTSDGAAYREVPVITAKVLDETTFGKPKEKSINDKVMDMYNAGSSVDEIAAELSISLTEVQFIIDLG